MGELSKTILLNYGSCATFCTSLENIFQVKLFTFKIFTLDLPIACGMYKQKYIQRMARQTNIHIMAKNIKVTRDLHKGVLSWLI